MNGHINTCEMTNQVETATLTAPIQPAAVLPSSYSAPQSQEKLAEPQDWKWQH